MFTLVCMHMQSFAAATPQTAGLFVIRRVSKMHTGYWFYLNSKNIEFMCMHELRMKVAGMRLKMDFRLKYLY